ncbi:MAG: hypothetical protein O6938_10760 [Gammaproteobacteria bacterium]|nr:hypothetical protein [Gammaproteobacteria bacterium]MCZ6724397.1 hypothetical protein [Gammaproteobacteria bacterium]MCZ6883051.1 hypothetical protein [Gammaproteobacteria bacterium]
MELFAITNNPGILDSRVIIPLWYIRSDRIKRGFCGICDSPIAYQQPDTDWLAIWIGTLDDRETYQPLAHVNSDNKISWVDIQAHLPYEYE